MIEEPTVFILGAGASAPYGYPTGEELRQHIYTGFESAAERYLRASKPREPVLQQWLKEVREFQKILQRSTTKSIDLFLARNPEFMELGKIAIILMMLAAEQNSKFREKVQRRELDWYSYLYDKLTDNLTRKEDYARFGENNASFVTFNYDRSLEHFLYESLLNSFNAIPSEKIKEQLKKVTIIHVFGQVAGLDWQELKSKIDYRLDIKSINVPLLAQDLRIIYEGGENPAIDEARELIEKADRIFFLGFGYARENLEILNIPTLVRHEHKVYGTALDYTKREISRVDVALGSGPSPPDRRHIENMDCRMLLREFL